MIVVPKKKEQLSFKFCTARTIYAHTSTDNVFATCLLALIKEKEQFAL